MTDLQVYQLRMNIFELADNSDILILDAIDLYGAENAILGIFLNYGIYANRELPYTLRLNYFLNLAEQIRDLSGHPYTDDDLYLYACYVVAPQWDKIDRNEVINILIPATKMSWSSENELYVLTVVKYKLLHLYSMQLTDGQRYAEMKELFSELQENREEYENLQQRVLSQFN